MSTPFLQQFFEKLPVGESVLSAEVAEERDGIWFGADEDSIVAFAWPAARAFIHGMAALE